MAVIANAQNGAPHIIDFSSLPTSQLLNGSATGGSGTYVSYEWYILSGPDGHTASFNNYALQSPTLQNIDRKGAWLLFLVVTDNLGEQSETDPLRAPDSARVTVYAKNQYSDIREPASGERNWHPVMRELYDEVDTFRNDFNTHTIADHDTAATGAQLDILVGGGNADALHTHSGGGGISVATEAANGVVRLAQPPLDTLNPKVLTRLVFAQDITADGTQSASGFKPGIIEVPDNTGAFSQFTGYIVTINEPVWIEDIQITMRDGGSMAGPAYAFELYQMSEAQFLAGFDFTNGQLGGTLTMPLASADHAPISELFVVQQQVFLGKRFVGIKCISHPSTPGGGLVASVQMEVRY